MVSHFTNTEPCPKCRSKGNDASGDNLARYNDGHAYCFRCGHYEPGDIVLKHTQKKEIVNSKGLIYPEVVPFSQECMDYLLSYGLTKDEIYSNLNGHEDGYSFFDSSYYLVRRLSKKPKVIVKGEVVGNEPIFSSPVGSDDVLGNTVCIVEDVISGIKVSRVITSCALLKSSLHDILLYRLASHYENCYLWLDPNMYEHMTNNILPRIKPYFKECKVIFTENDPKDYSTKEIRKIIAS